MYMEAYGNVGSVADNIIKSVAHTVIGYKMAKSVAQETREPQQEVQMSPEQTNSDVGVSSQNSGGVGSMADPNIVRDMNAVSRQKAVDSLHQKIEDLEARRIYLEDENKMLHSQLGKRLMRKGK